MKNFLIVCICMVVIFSCSKQKEQINTEEKQTVIATVNNQVLSLEQLKSYYTKTQWDTLSIRSKREFVRNWVDLASLAIECDSLSLNNTLSVKTKIKHAALKIKSNAYLNERLNNINITEDELFDWWNANKDLFKKDALEYKIQLIKVNTNDDMQKVNNALAGGMSFSDAAKTFSVHYTGSNGGYFGFKGLNDLLPELSKKIIELDKYQRGLVSTDKAVYLIRYYDTRSIKTNQTFNEAKAKVYANVIKEKQKEEYQNIIKSVKNNKDIEIKL